MSSHDVSRSASGSGVWRGDAVFGALVLTGVAASLVSARLVPFALFALLAALAVRAIAGGRWRDLVPAGGAAVVSLTALLLYCLASTLWAEAGGKAVAKLFSVAATAGAAVVLAQAFLSSGRELAVHAAKGLCIGFAGGLAFLLIELVSGQAIQIATYNLLHLPHAWMQPERHFFWTGDTLTAIEPSHINRSLAVAALLAFPAALAARATLDRPWSIVKAAAFVGLAAVAAALSRHESSMAALAVGLVIFVLGWKSRTWAARAVGAGWVLACIAVLPVALLAGKAQLERTPWLHHSMQDRFVIWNTTAKETLKAPILGIGAYMTYVLGPERNKNAQRDEGVEYKKTFSRHAHNVYLQTWFELGAVGAVLLMVCGLSILAAIRRLKETVQPFALAAFATGATMMSSSYGMWQTWYLALFAFTAVALAIAARAADGRDA